MHVISHQLMLSFIVLQHHFRTFLKLQSAYATFKSPKRCISTRRKFTANEKKQQHRNGKYSRKKIPQIYFSSEFRMRVHFASVVHFSCYFHHIIFVVCACTWCQWEHINKHRIFEELCSLFKYVFFFLHLLHKCIQTHTEI